MGHYEQAHAAWTLALAPCEEASSDLATDIREKIHRLDELMGELPT